MRSRKWFLTINDGADSWYKFKDIVVDLNRCKYAYIIHDKEDNLHSHVILNFENARSYESVCNTFVGSHVEPIKYYNMSMRYLVHLDDAEKFRYNIDDIVSNYNKDELLMFMNADEFEYLSTESLLTAIDDCIVCSISDAVRIWGVNQVNTKRALIETLLKEKGFITNYNERIKNLEHDNVMLKSELNIYKALYGDLEKGDNKYE